MLSKGARIKLIDGLYKGRIGKIIGQEEVEGVYKIEYQNGIRDVELEAVLEEIPLTLDSLMEGDEVRNGNATVNGKQVGSRMLGVFCGNCIVLSEFGEHNRVLGIYTVQQLKDEGYTVKEGTPSDTIEVEGKKYKREDVEKLKEVK